MSVAPAAPGLALPTHRELLAAHAEAEQEEGWLARCADANCYLALSAPLVDALAGVLRGLRGTAPVLELCAGDGALAAALAAHGVDVIATDACPPPETRAPVERLAADAALARYRPRVVLGSFVPVDAGVDAAVLAAPSVHDYLVLNARLGGELGARCLWWHRGWRAAPLHEVTRLMVTRHDVWLDAERPPLRRGEGWHLTRVAPPAPDPLPTAPPTAR